jgi:hypothetical protein
MKPPRDDETNWDQLVASAIMGPEFQAAWETLKGSGIGSTEATSHVSTLIRGSRWHLERLHIQHETLMEAIQKFSAGQLNQAVVAWCLGLPEEEVLEEEKPLVN